MGKNFYDDNKFQNLSDELKNLPKLNTPDDFEFRLMARIKNKNFESGFNEEREFTFGRFLKPAFALGLVMILFLVVLNFQKINQEEPIIKTPAKLNNLNSGSLNNVEKSNEKIVDNTLTGSLKKNPETNTNGKSTQRILFSGKTVDIDNELKQSQSSGQSNEFGVLAGSEKFSGFGVRVPARKGEIDSVRNKIDSIRNASKR